MGDVKFKSLSEMRVVIHEDGNKQMGVAETADQLPKYSPDEIDMDNAYISIEVAPGIWVNTWSSGWGGLSVSDKPWGGW